MCSTGALLLHPKAHSIRDVFFRNHPAISFFLSCVLTLLMMSCPLLLLIRALLFFCPLLVSTGICLTAFYLFFQSQDHRVAGKERLVIKVGRVEHVVEIRVSGEAKFGVCSDHAKVDCFLVGGNSDQMEGRASLRRRPADDQETHPGGGASAIQMTEEGEVDGSSSVCDEDMYTGGGSDVGTDDLAEGLWNCYFGSCSRWHHEEEEDSQVYDVED